MKLREIFLPARAAAPLIRTLARFDLAWAAARVARLTMHRVDMRRTPDRANGAQTKRRVLLLPKAGLRDDAVSTFSPIGAVQVVALPRQVIKAIAHAFLPSEVNDNNYSSASPAAHRAMLRYRAFLTRFWRALDPKHRIDAVVSGNFAYYAERELAAALEGIGVPFIALHKENSWTPGTQDFWGKIYRERRGPFLGRRILVYSPLERDLQLGAGIVDARRIEVVGMPRLDEVHRWRLANVGAIPQPMVLFASFPSDVGMPALRKGTLRDGPQGLQRYMEVMTEGDERLVVTELCRATHRALVELAASCPDIEVVVKTKGRARDRDDVPGWLGVQERAGPAYQHAHRAWRLAAAPDLRGGGGVRLPFDLAAGGAGRRSSRDRSLVRRSAQSRGSPACVRPWPRGAASFIACRVDRATQGPGLGEDSGTAKAASGNLQNPS